jgi:hypothetical protein
MGASAHGFSPSNPSGLPRPKVRLSNLGGFVDVIHSETTGVYQLFRYPTISAQDLTTEQIKKGVYIEMLHYKPRGSRRKLGITQKVGAGYVVPSSNDPFNLLPTEWSRSGGHHSAALRHNHYKVTSKNQILDVWQYLDNRHKIQGIYYRLPDHTFLIIDLMVKVGNRHSYRTFPGVAKGYSGQYVPYYFMFRYIMWDEATRQYISGPVSDKVKLTHRYHPFVESTTNVGNIEKVVAVPNSTGLFDRNQMICHLETKVS